MINDVSHNMRTPCFTVIIPTYNRSKHLINAIMSVISSTYDNFEIIIVDDGSTDDTRARVESIIDPRIRYFFIKNSGGPARPRNIGICESRGDWICFLDSDDLFLPLKLERLEAKIRESNTATVLYSYLYTKRHGLISAWEDFDSSHALFWLFIHNPISLSSSCVSRDFIQHTGIRFDEDGSLASVEDFDFWISLYLNGANFLFIEEALGVYNDDKETNISNSVAHFRRTKIVFDRYKHRLGSLKRYIASDAISLLNMLNQRRLHWRSLGLLKPITRCMEMWCTCFSIVTHPIGAICIIAMRLRRASSPYFTHHGWRKLAE